MFIDSTAQYFVLLLPVFLMVLGGLCLLFWFNKRDFQSVFWLGIAGCFHGTAFLIQSLTSFDAQASIYWLILLFYILNYVCFTQAVVLRFHILVDWRFCFCIFLITEVIILYFSFLNSNYAGRLISFALAVMIILIFYSVKIYKLESISRIHVWLKRAYYCCALIFIGRVILLTQYSINNHAALLNFQSTTHWFLNQIFILIITMIFAALIIATHFYEEHHNQQIKLLKAKQQERLHISQDLHDTLGSSLVRSIGVMSQNHQQINQQQVLAMLKLFRDDLRQVIDNNIYSESTIIPEDPKHWAAPIRHRFSQIFEELHITATWQLDAAWQSRPSVLDCVNLRRITEELLTNVIKHSQATLVSINLYYTTKNVLALEICDNGIGFDTNIIQAHNINIGLNSIGQRIKQISAQIDIKSNHLGTCILIQKIYA